MMLAIAAMLVWRGECGEWLAGWLDGDCSVVASQRSDRLASLFLFGHVDRRGARRPSPDALLLARQNDGDNDAMRRAVNAHTNWRGLQPTLVCRTGRVSAQSAAAERWMRPTSARRSHSQAAASESAVGRAHCDRSLTRSLSFTAAATGAAGVRDFVCLQVWASRVCCCASATTPSPPLSSPPSGQRTDGQAGDRRADAEKGERRDGWSMRDGAARHATRARWRWRWAAPLLSSVPLPPPPLVHFLPCSCHRFHALAYTLLSHFLLCRIDFKIKTIELDGKRIKLQIWVGPLRHLSRHDRRTCTPQLHAAIARHNGRMPSTLVLWSLAHISCVYAAPLACAH